MKTEEIDKYFTYQPPKPGQPERYVKIREAARALAHVINENCPDSADKSAAIRQLRETVATANASIALE